MGILRELKGSHHRQAKSSAKNQLQMAENTKKHLINYIYKYQSMGNVRFHRKARVWRE
jgi:hypothetical protein